VETPECDAGRLRLGGDRTLARRPPVPAPSVLSTKKPAALHEQP